MFMLPKVFLSFYRRCKLNVSKKYLYCRYCDSKNTSINKNRSLVGTIEIVNIIKIKLSRIHILCVVFIICGVQIKWMNVLILRLLFLYQN